MQIGAHVYCDSQCIIRELERRFPHPTLYPGGGAGIVWGVSRWTDGPLFSLAIELVLGAQADQLPPEFAVDRTRLYFGPDNDLQSMKRNLPYTLAQLRAQIGWVEQRLATGRDFILGAEPGLPDALCYYVVWFIRGRYADGESFLAQFPRIAAWAERVAAIGHGVPVDLDAAAALDVARSHDAVVDARGDAGDPQGLRPGLTVGVTPIQGDVDPTVTGTTVSVSAEEIAIRRTDARAGEVVVHFPRVGYRVEPLD